MARRTRKRATPQWVVDRGLQAEWACAGISCPAQKATLRGTLRRRRNREIAAAKAAKAGIKPKRIGRPTRRATGGARGVKIRVCSHPAHVPVHLAGTCAWRDQINTTRSCLLRHEPAHSCLLRYCASPAADILDCSPGDALQRVQDVLGDVLEMRVQDDRLKQLLPSCVSIYDPLYMML